MSHAFLGEARSTEFVGGMHNGSNLVLRFIRCGKDKCFQKVGHVGCDWNVVNPRLQLSIEIIFVGWLHLYKIQPLGAFRRV